MRQLLLINFVCALLHPVASAHIWTDHVKPTVKDGFDWTGAGLLLGGGAAVALLVPQDNTNQRNIQRELKMSNRTQDIGDFLGTGIPGILIALTQFQYDAPRGRAHTEAIIYTFVMTKSLKLAIGRRRPNGTNRQSMPSGHTSTAFASATSLAYSYGWKWGVPAYILATFVGLERIVENAHWTSDVVAGAVIGTFWGRASFFHELGLSPVVSSEGGGISWNYDF